MYNLNQLVKPPTRHNIIVFNLVLWFVVFWILLFIFSKTSKPIKIDYIYTAGFIFTLISPVLLNFYILIPKLLKRQRYLLYILGFIANIAIWERLHSWLFRDTLDAIFKDYFFVSYHSNTSITIIFIVVLVVTAFVKLTEDWIYYNANESKLLRENNQIIESQLLALRSQINPHFLFNSLNVIYSMAIEEKKDIKSAILQLSDILRYIIYDADTKKVPLSKEIELLSNYIEFQKYRTHNINTVRFNTSVDNETFHIYPMLLLPIVENAFKHADFSKLGKTITLDFIQNKTDFMFSVSNPISENNSTETVDFYSGFGLESIKKNLEIVYPNQHLLNITSENTKFKVELKLFNL
ncbi:histidine kinase [Ichthyenterobacterium sp. W332]|uniref:Histidine kinase n=1 Tax=Microcosmobacter mediterraneus TaxID=3075607 RepID=A0ABU2YH18_9FLAO|nr:histidine kinase [Ichthyenterobacterium sp. W332]MDT0557465.1 histidine kinase [Ichthyenterobacterium sp. W332]